MAGQDELIYRIRFEVDEASLQQIKGEADSITVPPVEIQFEASAEEGLDAIAEAAEKAEASLKQVRDATEKAEQEMMSAAEAAKKFEEREAKLAEAQSTNISQIAELSERVRDLRGQIRENNKAIREGEGDIMATVEANELLKIELGEVNAEYRRSVKDATALRTDLFETANTYQELADQNKALMAAMREVPLDDTTGALEKLQQQYEQNNNKLKAFDEKLGNHQRNVGNYPEAWGSASAGVETALGKLDDSFGGAIGMGRSLLGSMQGVAAGFKAGEISAYGFMKALISTGIGAIIVGIGVAVGALISAMSKLQPVMDKIAAVTNAVSTGFAVLTDKVYNFITGNDEATTSIVEAAKAAYQLSLDLAAVRDAEIGLIETQARLRRDLALLRQESEDVQRSAEDRLKSTEEALALQRQILESDLEIARERARIAAEQSAQARDDAEAARATAEAQAKVYELEQQAQEMITTLVNRRNQILKEISDEQIKRDEEERKRQEELTKKQNEEIEKRYEAFLADLQRREEARLASMDREADAEIEALLRQGEAIRNAEEEIANTRLSNRIEALQSSQEYISALEVQIAYETQQRIDALLKEGVSEYEAIQLAKTQIDEQYAKQREEAAAAEAQFKNDLATSTAQNLLTIGNAVFGESKALAIAETILNTYKGAQSAFADTKGGIIVKSIAAAAAIAQGIANLRKIKQTQVGATSISQDSAGGGGTSTQLPRAGISFATDTGVEGEGLAVLQAGMMSSTSTARPISVEANVDQQGVAIAVREGERQIQSQQFSYS